MDCFDYLQSHKDFSQLTWVPPVWKANENRSRRGPCVRFPGEEPTLVAATLPPVEMVGKKTSARGGSAGPRESSEERGTLPSLGRLLGQRASCLQSWLEAGFWLGSSGSRRIQVLEASGCGFGFGFFLLFFLPVTGSALFRETGP